MGWVLQTDCRNEGWSGDGEEEGEPGAHTCTMGSCEDIRGIQQQGKTVTMGVGRWKSSS